MNLLNGSNPLVYKYKGGLISLENVFTHYLQVSHKSRLSSSNKKNLETLSNGQAELGRFLMASTNLLTKPVSFYCWQEAAEQTAFSVA